MKFLFLKHAFFMLCLAVMFNSCKNYPPTDLTKNGIIPKPVSVVATHGAFELTDDMSVYVSNGDEELMRIGDYLSSLLSTPTGFKFPVIKTDKEPSKGGFYLTVNDSTKELGEEGYELTISDRLVRVMALKPAGLMRGLQTLRQLLPPKIEADSIQEGPWLLATGTIRDYPEYAYRGAMLDVARHFFGVEDVKRYIDHITMYKMNIFHFHLTDDQGWRVEIKSWPNLTKHGGSTQVGGGKGGFYTQEKYKEIVRYAQDRYITVVPEVDMPGHTNAALASYPELSCDGKAPELYTGIKVGFSTFCTNKEVVYQFVDDVVRELSEMTPGPYFHIGGDESHSTKEADYVYFVNRVQNIVESYGKRIIGWDEIAHATLADNAVVQYWSKDENALIGVGQGAKVIMSPASRAYLDMKYDSTTVLGLNWAGTIEVDHGYNWNPATLVEGIGRENILGVEAPLWTETLTNMNEIEQLAFPRIAGYAEIGWSRPDGREWDEYKVRLAQQRERYQILGINFYPSALVPWNTNTEKE